MGNIFRKKRVKGRDSKSADNVDGTYNSGKTDNPGQKEKVYSRRQVTTSSSSPAENVGGTVESFPATVDGLDKLRKLARELISLGDEENSKVDNINAGYSHAYRYDRNSKRSIKPSYAPSREFTFIEDLFIDEEYYLQGGIDTFQPTVSQPPVHTMSSPSLEQGTSVLLSAGTYEVELNWEGESQLHNLKNLCRKHPRHPQFIPVSEFNQQHLPALYRNDLIVDLVNCLSTLTVRLRVDKISLSRPKPPYPPNPRVDNIGRDCSINGTGHVSSTTVVYSQGAGNSQGADNSEVCVNWEGADNSEDCLCGCAECLESGNPARNFGKIFIQTAAHVVHDDVEAANTTCFLNYINDNDGLDTVIKIQGAKGVQIDVKEDRCWMFCYTHDLSLVKKLDFMTEKYQKLRREVSEKYCVNWSDIPEDKLTIIVSHPHGCSKYVTVGNIEGRLSAREDEDWTQYKYTTPTCPGSSGAPIFMLGKHGYIDNHHHSGSLPDTQLNISTFGLF